MKRAVRRILRRLGYDVIKVPAATSVRAVPAPPIHIDPVWPLPRRPGGPSDDEIRAAFARHPRWHYAYAFERGLTFPTSHDHDPERPLQRFRHFMPYLVHAQGGSLAGKRVLDIACNAGFWSIQCALLGAEVVGFDARREVVEQANLVKSVTGATNVEFRVMDFRQMRPEALGGEFDVVLNLGFLYHVPEPLRALELTRRMARKHILLDTAVHPTDDCAIHLKWEEPSDIRMAAEEGVVAVPTRNAVELLLRHMRVRSWTEIPMRTRDLPEDYLTARRTSWLIEV